MLVQKLIMDKNDEPLQGTLEIAYRLLQCIEQYEREVMAFDGIGKHYQEVVGISQCIWQFITWLEDVWCNSMDLESENDLTYLFHNHQLMYQS